MPYSSILRGACSGRLQAIIWCGAALRDAMADQLEIALSPRATAGERPQESSFGLLSRHKDA
jgi:hypothetical protein